MTKKEIAKETIDKFKERMESAELLIKAEKYEDSISRTYYALFDAIRGMLEIKKITVKSHQGAINRFNEFFIKSKIFNSKFAKTIKQIQDLRETADYTFQIDLSKEEAKKAFEEVEKFLLLIEDYLKDNYLAEK